MQTKITARHFKATPELRTYVTERLSKLERYYNGITDVHVILEPISGQRAMKQAEISLNVYRQNLVAQEEAATHEEAIDHCIEGLRRQIMKYKTRLKSTQKDHHR